MSPLAPSRTAPAACAGIDAARDQRDAVLAGWLAAAARGDADAFEQYYDATVPYARALARRLLQARADVEDLLADAYFEAWRQAARHDVARGSAVTWLLLIVRSRAIDRLRQRPAGAGVASQADEPAPDTATEAGQDPAECLWRQQAGTRLHAALRELTPSERWVLGLAYFRELSHGEIARCTGLPLGTVKSHLARAQQRLRAALAAH